MRQNGITPVGARGDRRARSRGAPSPAPEKRAAPPPPAPPPPPEGDDEAGTAFVRFDRNGDGWLDNAEAADMVERLGLVPLGGTAGTVAREVLAALGAGADGRGVDRDTFRRGYAEVVRLQDESGIDYGKAEAIKEGVLAELGARGCLLAEGEAPVQGGVSDRAVSLEAVKALSVALEGAGAYNLPTFIYAVKCLARGPAGEPVRLAELLSPRHVARPRAFISHMWSVPGHAPFQYMPAQVLRHYGYDSLSSDDRASIKVWVDVFAVSQHRGGELQELDFAGMHGTEKVAGERDGTLFILDRNGVTLTRIWCLYEIWRTVEECGAGKLHIVSQEIDGLSVKEVFVTLNVLKAKATVDSDRVRLLEEFEASETGADALNAAIKAALVQSARHEADEARGAGGHAEADALVKLATMLHLCTAEYAEAEPLLREALSLMHASLGAEHIKTATVMNELGSLLQDMGRLDEAEPLMRDALRIHRDALGAGSPIVGRRLVNIAALLQATGRLGEAEPLYHEALGIHRNALGPRHPDVAVVLSNLGMLMEALGRLEEAEPLLREALGISQAALGPDHPDVATRLNNLGMVMHNLGRYAEAEPSFREALRIHRAATGDNTSNVGRVLSNLSSVLQAAGRRAEAEPLLREALGICRASLGPDHPEVAVRLNNLGMLQVELGQLDEAEAPLREALRIWSNALGPAAPNVGAAKSNLGSLMQARGQLAEAEALRREGRGILAAAVGNAHPGVLRIDAKLAGLAAALGRPDEAEALYEATLRVQRAQLGQGVLPGHLAETLRGLGELLARDPARAEEGRGMVAEAARIEGKVAA